MVCHKQVVQGILHNVPPEFYLIRYLMIRKLIIIIDKNPSLSIEKPCSGERAQANKEIWYCSGVSIRQCGILNLKDIVKDNP